ncbi:MAG: AAA family ATPase [Candidatus Andersenbacteria bacterium]
MSAQIAAIVIAGQPVHGKTTAAEKVAPLLGFTLRDVDRVRHEHVGGATDDVTGEEEHNRMVRAYALATEMSEQDVDRGVGVVQVGPHSRVAFKQPLYELVQRRPDFPLLIFHLDASPDKIEERLATRASDPTNISPIVTMEQYVWARKNYKPWWPGAGVRYVLTDDGIESTVDQIVAEVERWSAQRA